MTLTLAKSSEYKLTKSEIDFRRLSQFLTLFIIVFFCACNAKQQTEEKKQEPIRIWTPSYAKGFEIQYYNDYKIIVQKQINRQYASGSAIPASFLGVVVPKRPQKTVLASTIIAAWFQMLGQEASIVGFNGSQYIYNTILKKRVADGLVKEVSSANGAGLNAELLLSLQPQVVFSFYDRTGGQTQKLLESTKIPTVYTSEHLEKTPLAQAEWLIFIAAFFDAEENAKQIFGNIANAYTVATNTYKRSTNPKYVFCNIPFKDVWYTPSRESFPALLVADAGGIYCFGNLEGKGSVPLSVEKVLVEAYKADIWLLNSSMHHSMSDVLKEKEEFARLKAFRTKQIYNPTKRMNGDGNDFFETGITRPDLVVRDLAEIFRTDSLPSLNKLYFYKKLE